MICKAKIYPISGKTTQHPELKAIRGNCISLAWFSNDNEVIKPICLVFLLFLHPVTYPHVVFLMLCIFMVIRGCPGISVRGEKREAQNSL